MTTASTMPELRSAIRRVGKSQAKRLPAAKRAGAAVFTLALWNAYGSLLIALLILGMMLAARRAATFARWAVARRRALAAAKLPVLSFHALFSVWRTEGRRLKLVTDRWAELCRMNGLSHPPKLTDHRADLDGNVTARMVRTGLDPDDVKPKAHKLAKGLGCRELVVRETMPGCADVKFLWTDPLGKVLPLRDLPVSDPGRISFGVTASGEAATLEADLSTMFAGVSGAGKSNAAHAALADLVRKGEPVRLYVSNPKRNELGAFKENVGRRMGNVEVHAYAETPAENTTLIANFENAMNVRNSQMTSRKLTTPTADNPRCILWLDEMLWLPKDTYSGPFTPLGRILSGGRACMFTVFGCAQVAYAADLGSVRGLFAQRVAFRTTSEAITNTILGDNANLRGAACHTLHKSRDRGVGFAADKDEELVKFRAAHVTEADLATILQGRVPAGMRLHAEPEPEPELREPFLAILRRWAAAAWAKLRRQVKAALIGAAVAVDSLR